MADRIELTGHLRRLLYVSLGAVLLLGVTVASFFFSTRRVQLVLTREREVARIGRAAAALATDRETGIRGYQLTRDQRSLVPELVGRIQLPPKLDSLRRLTRSDPARASAVEAISVALERWEKEFATPAMDGQVSGASMLAGKPLFDQVRAAFDGFLTGDVADLERDAARFRTLQIFGVGLVLVELLAFVGILVFVIRGQLMRMAQTMGHQQDLLEQQAVELELQVTELQATALSLADREEALRKSEERYRFAARATNDAIYDWDVASNKFEWNDGLGELFGYTADNRGSTIEWIVSLLHPDDTERVMDSFYAVFERGGGSQWKAEYRLRRSDGKYAAAEGRAYIIRSADGNPQRVIGAISDRTQQQSLEGQLRQSQKMEAIGRLAGGIAHDFNNILTVIRMSSEFLLEDMPDTDARIQDAREIMSASVRASRLTRQLLAFSRHQVLNPTVVVLNDIVSEMEEMLRRILPEHIKLHVQLDPELRSINADAGQMEQVLLNLVVNAADAMPSGGKLSVRTSNTTVDAAFSATHLDVAPGPYVCLTVSDTGVGMDRDTLTKIFEPFFTTKDVGHGTGLGLSTVHGIVTQSGGKIWVYSEPELGTAFKIFLPRADGSRTPLGNPVVEEWVTPQSGTILLVEDERATRAVIGRGLARAGYTVIEATNGVEALAIAVSHPGEIDLLITDSMMPEMRGTELVGQLRRQRTGIAVLMMSGYSDELAQVGEDGESEFFIEKPFNIADLLFAIHSALKVHR
ncbi:MAG TPA: ATP-binding protein [Gemmatimonadaceae bacterium]